MSPDTDAKPLWQSFHGGLAWPSLLECLASAAFLARSLAAGVPLIAGRGRLAFSLIACCILPLVTERTAQRTFDLFTHERLSGLTTNTYLAR